MATTITPGPRPTDPEDLYLFRQEAADYDDPYDHHNDPDYHEDAAAYEPLPDPVHHGDIFSRIEASEG